MLKKQKSVIIIDDEASMRKNITDILSIEGYHTYEAEDGFKGIEYIKNTKFDLVLLDFNMPIMDGLTVLTEIKKINEDIPVIILTAYGTNEKVIEAIKSGAYDYMEKPFELEEFLLVVERAIKYLELVKELKQLRTHVSTEQNITKENLIIGNSSKMKNIMKLIGLSAPSDATVLIQGESGTGKELIADAIQRHSSRKDKPYIKVNCGALSESLLESEIFGHEKGAFTGATSQKLGRFELANEGTIFLDEINSMPHSLQVKVLRVLQQQSFYRVGGETPVPINVRIIAASNKNVENEVEEKRLRKDLYYRLNVIRINLPPLRDRSEDIPLLIKHFLTKFAGNKNVIVSEGAMRKFMNHSWNGNVRELENIIRRGIVIARDNVIDFYDLIKDSENKSKDLELDDINISGNSLKEILSNVEKNLICKALNSTSWNQTEAAKKLNVNRRFLYSKIKEYNISMND